MSGPWRLRSRRLFHRWRGCRAASPWRLAYDDSISVQQWFQSVNGDSVRFETNLKLKELRTRLKDLFTMELTKEWLHPHIQKRILHVEVHLGLEVAGFCGETEI